MQTNVTLKFLHSTNVYGEIEDLNVSSASALEAGDYTFQLTTLTARSAIAEYVNGVFVIYISHPSVGAAEQAYEDSRNIVNMNPDFTASLSGSDLHFTQ